MWLVSVQKRLPNHKTKVSFASRPQRHINSQKQDKCNLATMCKKKKYSNDCITDSGTALCFNLKIQQKTIFNIIKSHLFSLAAVQFEFL